MKRLKSDKIMLKVSMPFLTFTQRSELKARHRCERDRRVCDRIKAVLLFDKGWTYQMIGEALLLDDQTVGNYVKSYRESGKLKHESGGSSGKLTPEEAKALTKHLELVLHLHIKDICSYVKETYQKTYTIAGMQSWMHRQGFVYKNPKGIPAKANIELQEKFIRTTKY